MKVLQMRAHFEVVPPAVGENSLGQYVYFPYTPRIESRLREKRFKNLLSTDL